MTGGILDFVAVAFGVLGVVGILHTIYAITKFYIPSNRIEVAESSFQRVYNVFHCARQEGLLTLSAADDIEARFQTLRADMDDAQEKILHIDSWWKYFISLFGGVASNLRNIEGTLKNLLVDISYNSHVARRELEKTGHRYTPHFSKEYSKLDLQSKSLLPI